MKIPKHVKILGTVQSIGYRPDKHRADKDVSFWETDQLVAVNDSKTTMYFFPKGKPRKTKKSGSTGKEYNIPTLSLKRIGAATRVVWYWEEIDETLWHVFVVGKCPALYADRYSNPRVLAMKYERGKIFNERGIL